MEVIHIAENTEGGYELVELIANRLSRVCQLAVIEKDGKRSYTGGFLLENCIEVSEVLDSIDPDKQYEFVKKWKRTPFEQPYLEDF